MQAQPASHLYCNPSESLPRGDFLSVYSVDSPRNTWNTRKGEEPTGPDRRNPGQVIFPPPIFLLSLLSARIRVIRGFLFV